MIYLVVEFLVRHYSLQDARIAGKINTKFQVFVAVIERSKEYLFEYRRHDQKFEGKERNTRERTPEPIRLTCPAV